MDNKDYSTKITAIMIILAMIGYIFTITYMMLC
jgi:hypothetical protein